MGNEPGVLLNNIITIYWIIVAAIYLYISFKTRLWGITWMIMVVASIVPLILEMIF